MTLQEQLQTLMKSKNISANKIAADIGYSAAVLSTWLAKKYTGNVAEVESAIKAYLDIWEERSALQDIDIPFVATKNAKTILGVLRRAHIDHKFNVVTAESGMGKTKTVNEYATRNRTAILIEVNVTFNAKILISVLHKRLGYSGKGTKYSMLTECIENLKGSDRLIIIDEADLLGVDSLEMMRCLHDATHVGIVLTGLPPLAENIRGSKGEFARIYTRVGGHARLGDLSQLDTALIVAAVIPKAEALVETFYRLCRKNGRTLYMLIYNAIRVARDNRRDIDTKLIEECAGMLAI
jgi:DNA transposition AAA+ family ATPase